ncbi:MAG: BglII/BstYI family type II restriction endonuclease [Gemmatimonadaceae bacterium]
MAKVVEELPFDGVSEKVDRLGLGALLSELRQIVSDFPLRVEERRNANGGAAIRKLLDARFAAASGWTTKKTGDIDWRKCHVVNGTRVCIGVEIQFSARSDLLAIDVHHLRDAITDGEIDVGILVVPSDRLSVFLTDRGPSQSAAIRHIRGARAQDPPLLVLVLEHDGPGAALPKQAKRRLSEEG